jgi:hypothetical protein
VDAPPLPQPGFSCFVRFLTSRLGFWRAWFGVWPFWSLGLVSWILCPSPRSPVVLCGLVDTPATFPYPVSLLSLCSSSPCVFDFCTSRGPRRTGGSCANHHLWSPTLTTFASFSLARARRRFALLSSIAAVSPTPFPHFTHRVRGPKTANLQIDIIPKRAEPRRSNKEQQSSTEFDVAFRLESRLALCIGHPDSSLSPRNALPSARRRSAGSESTPEHTAPSAPGGATGGQ